MVVKSGKLKRLAPAILEKLGVEVLCFKDVRSAIRKMHPKMGVKNSNLLAGYLVRNVKNAKGE